MGKKQKTKNTMEKKGQIGNLVSYALIPAPKK